MDGAALHRRLLPAVVGVLSEAGFPGNLTSTFSTRSVENGRIRGWRSG